MLKALETWRQSLLGGEISLDENQPLLESPLIGKLGGGLDGCRVIELIPRSRVCDKKLFWTETSAPFKLFVRQLDLILQQRNGCF